MKQVAVQEGTLSEKKEKAALSVLQRRQGRGGLTNVFWNEQLCERAYSQGGRSERGITEGVDEEVNTT